MRALHSRLFSIQRSIDEFDCNALQSSYLTSRDSLFSRGTWSVFQSNPVRVEIKMCAAHKRHLPVCLFTYQFLNNIQRANNPTSFCCFFMFFFFFSQLVFTQFRSAAPQQLCTMQQQQQLGAFFFSLLLLAFVFRLKGFHVFMWHDLKDNWLCLTKENAMWAKTLHAKCFLCFYSNTRLGCGVVRVTVTCWIQLCVDDRWWQTTKKLRSRRGVCARMLSLKSRKFLKITHVGVELHREIQFRSSDRFLWLSICFKLLHDVTRSLYSNRDSTCAEAATNKSAIAA